MRFAWPSGSRAGRRSEDEPDPFVQPQRSNSRVRAKRRHGFRTALSAFVIWSLLGASFNARAQDATQNVAVGATAHPTSPPAAALGAATGEPVGQLEQRPVVPPVLPGVAEWPATENLSDFLVADAPDESERPVAAEAIVDPLAPEGGYRSEIERAWFSAGADPRSRAAHTRARALEVGERNVEGAARALALAFADSSDPADLASAVGLAPDLPVLRMALARSYWQNGERSAAIVEVGRGLYAIPFHLEASLWLVSSLLAMAGAALVLASLAFVVAAGCKMSSRAAHDLGDTISASMPSFARAALLGSALMIPLALGEGLIGFVLAMFTIAYIYGGGSYRLALNLSVALLLIGLYPVARFAATALDALDSDPVATAALSLARGVESPAELAVLRAAQQQDNLAHYTLALDASGRGEAETLVGVYQELLERNQFDAPTLANFGNLHFRAGRTDQAIELYERAAALIDSPRLMFNLAQAYAKSFRMEEFESAMRQAQTLDGSLVIELSKGGDSDFVADLPYSLNPVRDRLLERADADGNNLTRLAVRLLAPGRLGSSWIVMAASFAIAALFSTLLAKRFDHSSSCNRCGRRICARCDGTVWSSRTCEGCYRLFNRPETTDAALRMERLKALRAREDRIDRISAAVSVLVPGAGGLLAQRPDLSFLGILLFACAVVSIMWRNGVVPDPLAVGAAGPLAFSIAGVMAALGYALVVIAGLLARRSL